MRVYVYVRVLYIPTRTHAEVGKYTRTVVVGGGGVAGSPIKGQDLRSEFYGANDVVSVAVVGATQKPARTKDVAHPGGLPDMFIGYGVCVYPRGSSVVGSRVRGPVFFYTIATQQPCRIGQHGWRAGNLKVVRIFTASL